MKKFLHSTFGTLVLAAFLAITPPMYARGGQAGVMADTGGHAVRGHAAAGHVKGGHAGFRARGARGPYVARAARGHARFAGRACNWNGGRNWGGRHWGGNYWYPSSGYSGWAITAWATAIHPTELAITVIPTVGTIRTTVTTLTATDTGRP